MQMPCVHPLCRRIRVFASESSAMADFAGSMSEIACLSPLGFRQPAAGGEIVKHGWIRIVGTAVLAGTVLSTHFVGQTAQTEQARGPYARIAIMRALDGHAVE